MKVIVVRFNRAYYFWLCNCKLWTKNI